MEIETLTILKDISWAGVIGLIVWCLFRPALLHLLNKQNNNGLNIREWIRLLFLLTANL